MQMLMMKLKDIIPYKNNPRLNDDAVDDVAESIKQCGYCAPIILDEKNVILAGHTRLKALQKLNWDEAEVVVKEGLTDKQKKKYRLLDNKTGEKAQWDYDLLPLELVGIEAEMKDFGFDFFAEDDFSDQFTLDDGEKKPYQQISITVHEKQAELILAAIDKIYACDGIKETFGNENRNGNGIYEVVRQWAELKN